MKMRKILTLLFTALAIQLSAGPVPLADPFILLDNGTYYAYGTHSADGIEVYTSQDLKNWRPAGLALKKGDVWGKKWFWAPEVYRSGDKFIMYYSAEEHIWAAVADSPLGPFKQSVKAPMLPGERNIDHTLFIDSDGKARIFFCRLIKRNDIWTAELENDLVTIKKDTIKFCIAPEQPWELENGRINEGAAVIKHNNKYYLTYSGNGYTSKLYGIGYAVSDSPEGPWVKSQRNPIFQNPGGKLSGSGHHAIFKDKAGKLKIVFHSHRSDKNIHPRIMHITDAEFKDGELYISEDFITPQLVK